MPGQSGAPSWCSLGDGGSLDLGAGLEPAGWRQYDQPRGQTYQTGTEEGPRGPGGGAGLEPGGGGRGA